MIKMSNIDIKITWSLCLSTFIESSLSSQSELKASYLPSLNLSDNVNTHNKNLYRLKTTVVKTKSAHIHQRNIHCDHEGAKCMYIFCVHSQRFCQQVQQQNNIMATRKTTHNRNKTHQKTIEKYMLPNSSTCTRNMYFNILPLCKYQRDQKKKR